MNKNYKIVNNLKILLFSSLLYLLSIFIKRDENKIAFGSWAGNSYSDNSKYLLEYILNNNLCFDKTIYWVGNREIIENIPKKIKFLKLNELKTCLILLKCKYFFCSQMVNGDICKYYVYRGSIIIYLDHGIPIKKSSMDAGTLHKETLSMLYYCLHGVLFRCNYVLASSPLHVKANISRFSNWNISEKRNLCLGSPRNDYLIKNNNNIEITRLKEKYSILLGFNPNDKIVAYLPTFRWKLENTPSLFYEKNENKKNLNMILKKNNFVMIEKSHNRLSIMKYRKGNDILLEENMILTNKMIDTQELLMISDILISDFSGCILDFLLLDRPIIHYIPDYIDYKNNDAGLYYDLHDFCCGDVAFTFYDLMLYLKKSINGIDEYKDLRKTNTKKYLTYETAECCENICSILSKNSSFNEYSYTSNLHK